MEHKITPNQLSAFEKHLRETDHADGTIEKYLRDVRAFARYLNGQSASKELSRGATACLRRTVLSRSTQCLRR